MSGIAVPRDFTIGGVDPDDTIILKSVSGLTPSDVTLFTGDFAGNGGYYQGRRIPGRNPVFNFKLNPDYAAVGGRSVSSLREELYSMFYEPTYYDEGLTVDLYDDELPTRTMKIYADKYQGDIFSQSTDVQISTQCMEPFLIGPETQVFPAGGTVSIPITYSGSAATGFNFQLAATATGTAWSVSILGKTMTWSGGYVNGDVFNVGTEDGNRYIKKNGVDSLGGLTATSDWLTLSKGGGTLVSHGDAVGDGKITINEYDFTSKWWGA